MLLNIIGDRASLSAITRTICAAIPSFKSIDDFLFTHSHDEKVKQVGKMAIARVIAKAEQTSIVKQLADGDLGSRAQAEEHILNTCMGTLIQLLATGISYSGADKVFDDLTIISFNYDRCVECILFHLLQPTFAIDANRAAEIMRGLRIFRPYGGLGLLYSGKGLPTPFGPSLSNVPELSERIRVYTEATDQSGHLDVVREALEAAGKVIFLGFGFHKQNMKLLQISGKPGRKQKSIYATAFKEPLPARETIQLRISRALHPRGIDVTEPDVDCNAFFKQYQILLAG